MANRAGALRAERAAVLGLCRSLDDNEWNMASAAPGWTVRDVIAHLGGACHALFTPASVALMRSSEIERANDAMVDARRSWSPSEVLAEFEKWSARLPLLSTVADVLPLRRVRVPLAELGTFPIQVLIGGAMVFDLHTHLRHDITPALGRPTPPTDANRMAVVVEWMLAVLANQLPDSSTWLDMPLSLTLTGPGGGSWTLRTNGIRPGSEQGVASAIVTPGAQFVEWATQRAAWRDRDVSVTGDRDYAEQFLDGVNIV